MTILYLSYDGLTSRIGQSQVAPYLFGLARRGYRFTVVCPEQTASDDPARESVRETLSSLDIGWIQLPFRTHPPIVAKLLDQRDLTRAAQESVRSASIAALHARSYVAGWSALKVKRKTGLPFIFDMRGFWADQRREGGRWRDEHAIFRHVYADWKRREARMIEAADRIVVLTKAAHREIETWPCYRGAPITIAPCTVDYDHFALRTPQSRAVGRAALGIAPGALVLAYLGSLGTVYLLGDMLRFFEACKSTYSDAKMLFIGPDSREEVLNVARAANLSIDPADIIVTKAKHSEIPNLLACADIGLCFITPTFSSKGVSPTKLGEYLAVGLPVIATSGIGDVDEILLTTQSGVCFNARDDGAVRAVVSQVARLRHIPAVDIRLRTRPSHHIDHALDAYDTLYSSLRLKPEVKAA